MEGRHAPVAFAAAAAAAYIAAAAAAAYTAAAYTAAAYTAAACYRYWLVGVAYTVAAPPVACTPAAAADPLQEGSAADTGDAVHIFKWPVGGSG